MTKIGTIRLNCVRTSNGDVSFESPNGSYRLRVPRHPDFDKLPEYIEITVSTESKWISAQEYAGLPDVG